MMGRVEKPPKKIGCKATITARVDARTPSVVHVRVSTAHNHGIGDEATPADLAVRMLDPDVRDWILSAAEAGVSAHNIFLILNGEAKCPDGKPRRSG